MFIERDKDGKVKGIYSQPQKGYAEEELPDDHPEVMAYLNPPPTRDQLDTAEARQYAKLQTLKSMSPSEINSWVEANITNLATAKDAIKTLAIAVSILARRI